MTSLSLKFSAIGLALGLAAFANAPASALPLADPSVASVSAGAAQIEQARMMYHKKHHRMYHHGRRGMQYHWRNGMHRDRHHRMMQHPNKVM
jgi:hypothetical protein